MKEVQKGEGYATLGPRLCASAPLVARHVEEGLVSVEGVRELYHVTLTQDRYERCAFGEEKTVRLRKVCTNRQETVEKQD